MKYFLSSLMIQ
jgi:hypothetical protein